MLATRGPASSTAPTPAATPAATSASDSRSTIQAMPVDGAPRAIRTPNSPVHLGAQAPGPEIANPVGTIATTVASAAAAAPRATTGGSQSARTA